MQEITARSEDRTACLHEWYVVAQKRDQGAAGEGRDRDGDAGRQDSYTRHFCLGALHGLEEERQIVSLCRDR